MGAGGRVRMTDVKKNIETPPSKGVLLWGSVTLGETAQSDKWSASMRRTQDLIPTPQSTQETDNRDTPSNFSAADSKNGGGKTGVGRETQHTVSCLVKSGSSRFRERPCFQN